MGDQDEVDKNLPPHQTAKILSTMRKTRKKMMAPESSKRRMRRAGTITSIGSTDCCVRMNEMNYRGCTLTICSLHVL